MADTGKTEGGAQPAPIENAKSSRESAPPVSGGVDAWVRERLAEQGLTEDDIGMVVEGAPGLHAEGGRWRICPSCKANIDMMTVVKGALDGIEWPRILPTGSIECPNCGCYGEKFGLNAMNEPHPKLKTYKAKVIERRYPWAMNLVREGVTLVEDLGLFPSDPMFNASEPHWPRDLAACILGGAMMLVSAMQQQVDRFRPDQLTSRCRGRRGRKNRWERRRGEDDTRGNKKP